MRANLLLGLAVVFALGCGSGKFAPVSGRVTLNGKPLANALVAFQPVGEEMAVEAGKGSSGKTNENGEYSLTATSGTRGAVVGKHQVLISTQEADRGDNDQRPKRGSRASMNKIPQRYTIGGKDQLTFVVSSGGTNNADFALTSP
jgi:hypothetical protein